MDYTTQYFRITAYLPEQDICFIMDSNGRFEKLWQFSAYVMAHKCKILEASTDEKFLDINITKIKPFKDNVVQRIAMKGKPIYYEETINGVTYKAVEIAGKKYIPER